MHKCDIVLKPGASGYDYDIVLVRTNPGYADVHLYPRSELGYDIWARLQRYGDVADVAAPPAGGIVETTGSSVGLSDGLWNTASIWAQVGDATGLGTVNGIPASIWAQVGGAAGTSTANGEDAAIWAANGAGQGLAVVGGSSASLWAVVWNADGVGTVLGEAEDIGTPVTGTIYIPTWRPRRRT